MFDRLEKVIKKENLDKIHKKIIAVIGLGGVGGYTLETLIRNGIENIILVDNDKVDITNKNRQIIALNSTINLNKVDVFEERIKDINPNVNIIKLNIFLNEDNKNELFKYKIDYLIDACDTVSTKIMLIKECLNKDINFISSMGTGNKIDPSKLLITELKNTSYDPLAKVIRHEINKLNITKKINVLSSTEIPVKNKIVGSYSVVPNIGGILIADFVIKNIINE